MHGATQRIAIDLSRAAALLLLTAIPGVSLAKPSMDAVWAEPTITIDGSADEWKEAMVYDEDAGAYIGVRNDGAYLYVCLFAPNRAAATRAVVRGISFELGKAMTVEFPVGLPVEDLRPRPGGSRPDPQALRAKGMQQLDVLRLEADGMDAPQEVSVSNRLGIEAGIGLEDELVVELKVPLRADDNQPYAIQLDPGDRFSFRIEPPLREQPQRQGQAGGAGGRAGRPPGRGGGFGRAGLRARGGPVGGPAPGRDGAEQSRGKPIEFKAKVRLAEAPEDE